MSKLQFSVLVSVYRKENPIYFNESLQSLASQSLLPNELIIVKDGPLTNELNLVIEDFLIQETGFKIKIIQLNKNYGLGYALNIGIKECEYDWVARMDSDDICHSNRFELLTKEILNSKNISVVGSQIEEFIGNTSNIVQKRKVKLYHNAIKKDLSSRNPMNHVSVMFKKSDVIKVGSYEDTLYFEDYKLWVKMILSNFKLKNIEQSTVYVRVGDDMIGRRHGILYARLELNFQRYLYSNKLLTKFDFFRNIIFRCGSRFLPKFILNQVYKISRLI